MANEYIRKEWAGGVVRTTLNGSINSTATAITVTDGSSFPSGVKPFVLVIDRGTATEEKIICSSRTGNNLTVLQRGYDGSSGQSHSSGAYIEHVLDAYTVDQANAIAATMTTQGDIVYKTVTGDNTSFGRLGIGTTGYPLVSAGTAPAYQQLGQTGIASTAVTAAKINSDVAGTGLVKDGTTGALNVNVDGSTLEVVTDIVRVKDDGITSAKILDGTIIDGNIANSTITLAKLAPLTAGSIVLGNASNVATGTAVTGDIAISSTGVTSIANNVIVLNDFAAGAKPVVICTSTTRPTGIVEGQTIYETDTDRIYMYDGTGWVFVAGQAGATVTGSAAIANGATTNLSYNVESYDSDNIIPASGTTFTIAIAGVYAFTIDLSSSADMNGGLGSKLLLTNTTRTLGCQLFGTEQSVTWILPFGVGGTATFSITNGTGASITWTYGTYVRLMGR